MILLKVLLSDKANSDFKMFQVYDGNTKALSSPYDDLANSDVFFTSENNQKAVAESLVNKQVSSLSANIT